MSTRGLLINADGKPFSHLVYSLYSRAQSNSVHLLGAFTLSMIILIVTPRSIYIRAYLQDTLGLFDGIHRTLLGQVAHRDFSTGIGIATYGIPSVLVYMGADPVNSLSYAAASLLAANFLVLAYLVTTRMPGLPGLLFGSWSVLVLTARLNFGEDPEFVTLAMSYNRYGAVFLSELILFFIPPRRDDHKTAIIDGLIMGVIATFLFYSKISFGLCALASIGLLAAISRRNLSRASVALILFLLIAAALEWRLHFHAALLEDVKMALLSSGTLRTSLIRYEAVINLPEFLGCAMLPIVILIQNKNLTPNGGMLFLFVSSISFFLLNQNAQLRVAAIPFTLFFLAWYIRPSASLGICKVKDMFALPGDNFLLLAAMCVMWFWYSYPLIVNDVVWFAKARSSPPIDAQETILDKLRMDWRQEDPNLVRDVMLGGLPATEIFERAINSVKRSPDPLSEADYATTLRDGVKAVREVCGPTARVLTADFVNPFPAILNLPVGGGMIYISPGRLTSERSYVSPEILFARIDCLMVPKLPNNYMARQFVLTVYRSYLESRYAIAKETAYWIVLRTNDKRVREVDRPPN